MTSPIDASYPDAETKRCDYVLKVTCALWGTKLPLVLEIDFGSVSDLEMYKVQKSLCLTFDKIRFVLIQQTGRGDPHVARCAVG